MYLLNPTQSHPLSPLIPNGYQYLIPLENVPVYVRLAHTQKQPSHFRGVPFSLSRILTLQINIPPCEQVRYFGRMYIVYIMYSPYRLCACLPFFTPLQKSGIHTQACTHNKCNKLLKAEVCVDVVEID